MFLHPGKVLFVITLFSDVLSLNTDITCVPFELIFSNILENTINVQRNTEVRVPFQFKRTCNTSSLSKHFYIRKESTDLCVFIHHKGACIPDTDICQCPQNDSKDYVFAITAETSAAGNYTWSPWQENAAAQKWFEDKTIQIIITDTDAYTKEATTKTLKTKITTKTNTEVSEFFDASETPTALGTTSKSVDRKPVDKSSDQRYEPAFFLSPPGIIIMAVNGAIVLSFICLVIAVVKRRGNRLRLSLQRDIPLQDLQHDPLLPSPGLPQPPPLPHMPAALEVRRSALGGRRYRSEESNFYESIGDDDSDDHGARISRSVPDLRRATDLPEDYLSPVPSHTKP